MEIQKYDQRTNGPTDRLTWVGARDAHLKMHKAPESHNLFQVLTNVLSERRFTCSPILTKTLPDEVTLPDSLKLLENRGLKLDLLFHGCVLMNAIFLKNYNNLRQACSSQICQT